MKYFDLYFKKKKLPQKFNFLKEIEILNHQMKNDMEPRYESRKI